jgi:hypothetical protein
MSIQPVSVCSPVFLFHGSCVFPNNEMSRRHSVYEDFYFTLLYGFLIPAYISDKDSTRCHRVQSAILMAGK